MSLASNKANELRSPPREPVAFRPPGSSGKRRGQGRLRVINGHSVISAPRPVYLPQAYIARAFMMGWTPPDGIDVPKWRC